ncbi:MAG: NUDIX hydrolase [Candidatus Paceibacterota bacterium]
MKNKKIMIVCRAIILDGDKMLLVENRKNENNFYCTAGGKMEFGENPKQTLEREIFEELGVKPEIGRLLYINTFNDGETQAVDFLYEVLNINDYKNIEKLKGTHSHELSKIVWLDRSSDAKVLPEQMWQDFKNDNLPKDKERYING